MVCSISTEYIRRDEEQHKQNKDIETELESTGSRLESLHFLSHAVDIAP